MTGAPSETWRKFRFPRRQPLLASVLDPLGGLMWGVIRARAAGYLPLTRRSSRMVALATWIPRGLIAGTIALWTTAAMYGVSSVSTAWFVFLVVGSLALISGLLGLLVKPVMCPRGRLMSGPRGDPDFVEIRNVHHAFVDAAKAMYAERMATGSPESLPLPPGSN
jgi:hypothetical protein